MNSYLRSPKWYFYCITKKTPFFKECKWFVFLLEVLLYAAFAIHILIVFHFQKLNNETGFSSQEQTISVTYPVINMSFY